MCLDGLLVILLYSLLGTAGPAFSTYFLITAAAEVTAAAPLCLGACLAGSYWLWVVAGSKKGGGPAIDAGPRIDD